MLSWFVFLIFLQSIIFINLDGPLHTNLTANGYNQSNLEVEIKLGSPVTIECVSHSEPPALYNIQYNGRQLNQDIKIGSYKIDELKISDEGDYICVASNPNLSNKEERKLKILVASKYY